MKIIKTKKIKKQAKEVPVKQELNSQLKSDGLYRIMISRNRISGLVINELEAEVTNNVIMYENGFDQYFIATREMSRVAPVDIVYCIRIEEDDEEEDDEGDLYKAIQNGFIPPMPRQYILDNIQTIVECDDRLDNARVRIPCIDIYYKDGYSIFIKVSIEGIINESSLKQTKFVYFDFTIDPFAQAKRNIFDATSNSGYKFMSRVDNSLVLSIPDVKEHQISPSYILRFTNPDLDRTEFDLYLIGGGRSTLTEYKLRKLKGISTNYLF